MRENARIERDDKWREDPGKRQPQGSLWGVQWAAQPKSDPFNVQCGQIQRSTQLIVQSNPGKPFIVSARSDLASGEKQSFADLRARCYRETKVSNLLVWGAQQTGSKEQRHAKFARSATVFLTGITKLINKVLCSATGQQKAANICNGAASLAGNGDRQGLPQSNSTGSVQRGQTVSRRRRGAGDGRAADCLRVLTAEAKIGPLHPCPQPTPPRPR